MSSVDAKVGQGELSSIKASADQVERNRLHGVGIVRQTATRCDNGQERDAEERFSQRGNPWREQTT